MPVVAEFDPRPSLPVGLPPGGPATLVDRYLFEQRELTAVERFSQRHEAADRPLQAR